jgi:hypothetical protein
MARPRTGTRRGQAVVVAFVTLASCLPWARASGREVDRAEASTTYRVVAVHGQGTLAALRARVDSVTFGEILRLNRVDADHAAGMDSLVVPEPAAGFRFTPPFPSRVPWFEDLPKLAIVSVPLQVFAAYDSGSLVRWGPASTGSALNPTLPGAFHVTWKHPEHRSTVDSSWVMRWCVNIENRVGMALHQYALVGRPASHCCIRLGEADARWVYDWADTWRVTPDERHVLATGTPVWILGTYDFEARPPWRRLPADPDADRVSLDQLRTVSNDEPDELPR